MRDRSRPDHDATIGSGASSEITARFGRELLGYRRSVVDDAVANLELRIATLTGEATDVRAALLASQHAASETGHNLTRARAELRYWNDRASYVDNEVARARRRAIELTQTARDRAEAIEADAQERSLQLIERVCSEANAILQSTREQAQEMSLRLETDVDVSQRKLDRLELARTAVAEALRSALASFEEAVEGVTSAAPARRIVELLEEPVRRAVPTFGRQKDMEAARRFKQVSAPSDRDETASPTRRVRDADEAFASLLAP